MVSLPKNEQLKVASINFGDLNWIYIEKPTRKEIDFLAQAYPFFHPLNLEDCLSQIQRPKLDEYDDHLFLVLHFPVFVKETRMCIPSEVDIFIAKNLLVTVHCSADLKPLSQLFQGCRTEEETRKFLMSKGAGYLLYQVIDHLVDHCFPMLDKINESIEATQDLVISKPKPSTAQEILVIKRDIISFRRIMHPQIEVIEILERKRYPFIEGNLEEYFGDIADHFHKIWGALEDQKEIIDALADTSNWLTSHRIQEVMRVLTIIMAILMPIEVVASMEGSNTLPTQLLHNSSWFFALLGIQCLIGLSMVLFLRRRGWI
jgi:magnesium transporter